MGEAKGRAAQNRAPTRPAAVFVKIRRALLGAVEQLQLFRVFIKPMYKSPKEAYNAFLSLTPEPLSRSQFLFHANEIAFPGKAEWVFETLQDGSGHIQRETFKQRIVQAKSMKHQPDAIDIANVAKLAKAVTAAQKNSNKPKDVPPRAPTKTSPPHSRRRDSDTLTVSTRASSRSSSSNRNGSEVECMHDGDASVRRAKWSDAEVRSAKSNRRYSSASA